MTREPIPDEQEAQDNARRTGLAVEWAAKELPVGYQINVCVESGAAWVELVGPGGTVDFDTSHEGLGYEITDATRAAIVHAIGAKP
jgi:hypothetical protein